MRSQISGFEASLPGEVQNRALAKILSAGRGQRKASGRGPGWSWNWGYGAAALASIAIVALIIGLSFYQRPEEVARLFPPPIASPTVEPSPEAKPSPEVEQPKTEKNDKQSEGPRRQQPSRRTAPVREPKPGEQFAVAPETVRPADAQTMTALHFERAETLLRAFRNVRLNEPGSATEVGYERKRAQQLVYQNMMLRREADASGDVQIASLLESLEPILLDIANLPDRPDEDSVRVIRDRVERKNIVPLLQINSTALARALD
ncbi:MAG TPA: hypothetical protein VGW58_08095 [Pyrinomonadaceae bacterium]|nr:hypothetical protein [Pyrinomonadaceae bacterium]